MRRFHVINIPVTTYPPIIIDSFNVQFGPTASDYTTDQPLSPTSPPTLRVGNFTGNYTTGMITQVTSLSTADIIGGKRIMTLGQISHSSGGIISGIARLLPLTPSPTNWQVFNTNGSRITASMIWSDIDPNTSGKFLDLLGGSGALVLRCLSIPSGGNTAISYTIKDSGDRVATTSPQTISGSNFTITTNFSSFTKPSDFNFNAVKYIELKVDHGSASGATASFDYLQAVSG